MNATNVVNLLTIAGLVAIMLSMGFKVTFAEVAAPMRRPRLVVSGLLANFVLAPAATAALLYLFEANPSVSVGFLILAVCPGAPLGPPFTAIAKGDVAYATGQMVILAGLSALLSPALLSLILPQLFPASNLNIDYLVIVKTLLVSQILPLGLGLSVHHVAPNFTSRIAKAVGLVGNLLLLSVVVLALVQQYEFLASIRPPLVMHEHLRHRVAEREAAAVVGAELLDIDCRLSKWRERHDFPGLEIVAKDLQGRG